MQAARAAGLSAVAVTDHDTVAAVEPVRRLAAGTGLHVVPGVEMSVHDAEGKEVHVLGLHVAELGMVERALAAVREARVERARLMVEKLQALGVQLGMADVLAEADGGAVGRPHVARALVKAGRAATAQAVFDNWIGAGKPAYVEKQRLAAEEGIAIIRAAGGIAIWAHPGAEGTRERVAALAAAGLDGLEVRHPSHAPADTERLRALVDELDLVPSGGSDWHGAAGGPRVLGCMHVGAVWMELQLARLAGRAA